MDLILSQLLEAQVDHHSEPVVPNIPDEYLSHSRAVRDILIVLVEAIFGHHGFTMVVSFAGEQLLDRFVRIVFELSSSRSVGVIHI